MNQRENVAAIATVGEQGAERRIFEPVTVCRKVPRPPANLHARSRSEVSLHANWSWSAKAPLMNLAGEL